MEESSQESMQEKTGQAMQDQENIKQEQKDNQQQDEHTDDNGQTDENGTENQEESAETQLADAKEQLAQMQDRLLRQMAEFDNYRKRTIKEKAELVMNGSAGIVTDILPVIDDMERAIKNAAESTDYNALKEGIELIYNKLMHTLEQKGVKKICPKDEPFNVDFHEAIAMIPAPDEKSKGLVIDCAIDGYMLNDKVLRHAKVAVAQ